MEEFSSKQIDIAYDRIKSYIIRTPLVSNDYFNKKIGANIFFKLENFQKTGSFKLRGAINKILQLKKIDKLKGIIAYSSGNHAQAVSYAANKLKIRNTIVMPKNAPKIKLENTRKYGAKLILYDEKKESREEIAKNISQKENKIIIKPYDDLDIIAGQGTAGKEIAEELIKKKIKPDIYLCCCGGGGLIAGTTTYLKKNFPKIKNYSVEPNDLNDTQISLKKKKIISNKKSATSICDALLAPRPGKVTFPINKKNVFSGLAVSDYEVKKAIIEISENLKIISEPGGAAATAALLSRKINVKNKNVIVMISGGNIDYDTFTSIIMDIK